MFCLNQTKKDKMMEWLHVTLIAVPSVILALMLIVILKRCFHYKKRRNLVLADVERSQTLQSGIARLHQVSPHHQNNHEVDKSVSENSKSYTPNLLFDWEDHPSLINDAVENGWPQFAFTSLMSSSPSAKTFRPIFKGVYSSNDQRKEVKVEIGWEVSEGSADFMQKIRLNPGMRKVTSSSTGAVVSLIRTALPLPGPLLNNSSFPQEAYFEITILPVGAENSSVLKAKKDSEPDAGDKILLISEDFNGKNSQDSLNHVSSSHNQGKVNSKLQELKFGGKSETILLSVGLTGGGPVPLKFPGSYSGSIGFNSTGSLYLDGTKLVPDLEGDEWGSEDNTIGCGYDPSKKKVLFTINSHLVHEIHCKTEHFGYPLYPTLAANGDVMVLVNLGQSPFKFELANSQRTSNPCFVGAPGNSPALSYEDSKELFSMGRIDAQWLQRNGTRSNNNTVTSIKSLEYESDGELFEIVLDSIGRSPFATPRQ